METINRGTLGDDYMKREDFEAILTKEQKKILKNMKKEGRRKFDKEHNHRKQLKTT